MLRMRETINQRGTSEGSADLPAPQLLDAIEPDLELGGQIIDWHACDLFPAALIDLVAVIRCDTRTLYDRLKARGYGDRKLDENMDAEIMEVLLEEARDAYDERIVVELRSEEAGQIEENVERLEAWVGMWRRDHGKVEGADEDEEEKP